MRQVEIAPAKLNLALRVLGKRDDGFHEIETIMVVVKGVADRLTFDLEVGGSGDIELDCSDPDLQADESNLVMRALRVFEAAANLRFCGRIHVEKLIPSGAGLGGGSSDAAATLRALDAVTGSELGSARLRELAAEIGSDVPFFVRGQPALCRGRGEIIEPLKAEIPATNVVLAKPGFGVPSAWAYSRWADSEELLGVSYGSQTAPWGDAVNDLERPVFEKYLVLPVLKAWLGGRPETSMAMMSGSGATVFATLRDGEDGTDLLRDLRQEFGDRTWATAAAIGSDPNPAT